MKYLQIRLFIAAVVWWSTPSVHAQVSCNPPTSAGFATAWTATSVVPNTTQTSVSVTCTRTVAGDPTVVYLRANNSNKCAGGGNNDARIGGAGNCISYEFHKASACNSVWSNNGAGAIAVSIPAIGAQTVIVPVWGCIVTAGQNPGTAGTYTDSVITSLRATSGNGAIYSSGTITASIVFPASCTITSITNVAFGTYVAFRNTPLFSTGGVPTLTCTTNLPYTMDVSPTSGVVVGLNYTLAMSATNGRGGLTPPTIIGTMPADQAGTCATGSCSGSNIHTLTVTY